MDYSALTPTFVPVTGVIQQVTTFADQCCSFLVSVRISNGIINFVVAPDTYIIDNVRLRPGLPVIAFYDSSLPTLLIYPPQYKAIVIGRRPRDNMMFGYFDMDLTATDSSLHLNIGRQTELVTFNGQPFTCSPGNHYLVVYYSITTRSIPPQTTPRKIIVIC